MSDELWLEAAHAVRGFFDARVDAASHENVESLRAALAPWERNLAQMRPARARRLQGALDALRTMGR